jgi:glucose 1-dehydrogenase
MTDRTLLAGQKALVTGANSGIGRSTAIALGRAGADVLVNYVEGEDAARAVVEEIRRAGAQAGAFQADVSDEAQVLGLFAAMQ